MLISSTAAVPCDTCRHGGQTRRLDHVILAYGVLGEQALAEQDPAMAQSIIDVNFRSAAAWSAGRGRAVGAAG